MGCHRNHKQPGLNVMQSGTRLKIELLDTVSLIFSMCFSFILLLVQVNSVRLPRHVANKKVFSGTALIEFSSEEDATKVLEQSLVYDGIDLELKPK